MKIDEIKDKKLKYLISRGVNLRNQGIYNNVFKCELALKVLERLFLLKIPILGGDVYCRVDEKFKSTYDNWHCDKQPDESIENYSERSYQLSKNYIIKYPKSEDIYFALVIES